MTRRFSCKNVSIPQAGTSFTHGLTAKDGTALTPDEWAINPRAAAPLATAAGPLYVASAPTSTVFAVASSSGALAADVFCWYNHSMIE